MDNKYWQSYCDLKQKQLAIIEASKSNISEVTLELMKADLENAYKLFNESFLDFQDQVDKNKKYAYCVICDDDIDEKETLCLCCKKDMWKKI